jgi:hypothetical protein
MSESLAYPDAPRSAYRLNVLPESLGKPVAPRRVSQFANTLRALAAYNLGFGLFAVLNLSVGRADLIAGFAGALELFVGGLMLWLAGRLLVRQITYAALLVSFLVVWGLMIASGFSANLEQVYGIYNLRGINPYTLIVTIGPLLVLYLRHRDIRGWLPTTVSHSSQARDTLAVPGGPRLLLGHSPYVVMGVGCCWSWRRRADIPLDAGCRTAAGEDPGGCPLPRALHTAGETTGRDFTSPSTCLKAPLTSPLPRSGTVVGGG